MEKYHKIHTVYKRDPENNLKTLLEGEYTKPEFEYLQNNIWEWDEKIDGAGTRIILENEQLIIKGKQEKSQIQNSLYTKLETIFQPRLKLMIEVFKNNDICMYGEGFGNRIQKIGGKYRPDQGFILFDIKIGHWWLKRIDVIEIAKILNMDVVPKIGEGTLHGMIDYVESGFNSTFGDFIAEGIVARPKIELKARSGERIITKLKYKDFVR